MVEKINSTRRINNSYSFGGLAGTRGNLYSNSIFSQNEAQETAQEDTDLDKLYAELKEVEDKQGALSQGFNEVKEIVGIGTSADKCDKAIEKFKNGEISYEEALAEIENFDSKQNSGLNLFSNIATSFAAIGAASLAAAAIIASGGTATPLVLAAVGAGAGAATKAGVKLIDRATNKVEGDALDGKQIARDALSGAVTGATAAATMGTGAAKATLKESIKQGAKSSARTGMITGAVSGSSNYMIDCAFDDKEFNVKDFASETITSAAIGGTVGAIVGSTNGALRYQNVIQHGGKAVVNGQIANASARDILANSVCSSEHKILNKTIRDIAQAA